MHLIETVCRRFLWPAGGLNITDILVWNKAAILKHYSNLCKTEDKLWIQWVHILWKRKAIWEVTIKRASWILPRNHHGGRQGISRTAMGWTEKLDWVRTHAYGRKHTN
ncbi:hypothetical protein H5410_028695 [Solanum commersonii]|uniref:Uncharacterized protein n=1 Tax=Solanum commersonii TaxID=4109 RepID=A0A9J5Z2N0_SOLCO|nr:hypothetical protein H5410_028695 [Solanum commersonii]